MQSIQKKLKTFAPKMTIVMSRALHITKVFFPFLASVFPHSLSFFQIKTSQPSIILMGHTQYRAKRYARNLRIPLFIPSKLFGYIWGKKVVLWHLHTKNSGKVLGNLDHSNGP